MAVFHKVTYQGLTCQAVSYRRSPWFDPEPGYVDINLRDLGQIKILVDDVPWPAVNGKEIEGQLPISAWNRLRPTVTAGRARPQGEGAPEGGGLRHFGDLVMQSYDGSTALSDEMRYNWVYVDSAGIEEVTRNLADIKAHNRGKVRVPLTDVRKYYRAYGMLVQRINVRSRAGYWDPLSLNDGVPWSLQDVIAYLLSQLPGSPAPSFAPDVPGQTLAVTPENLTAIGDPVVEVLEDLLKKNGLVPLMLPDGNFRVTVRGSKLVTEGEIAFDLGQYGAYPKEHYETKSAYVTDRPPLVQVIGKPVIRRITRTYVAALQDLDGMIYKLSDAPLIIGYSVAAIKAQVFNDEKQFGDLNSPEHREMLQRCAYKMYVPADAFEGAAVTDLGGSSVVSAVGVATELLEQQPFLPVQKAPMYVGDLDKRTPPIDDGVPDRERYVLMKPIAYGNRISQDWFEDVGALEDYFNRLKVPAVALIGNLGVLDAQLERLAAQYNDEVPRAADAAVEVVPLTGNPAAILGTLQTATKFVQRLVETPSLEGRARLSLNGDVVRSLKFLDPLAPHEQALQLAFNDPPMVDLVRDKIQKMRAEILRMRAEAQASLAAWNSQFSSFRNAFDEVGGIQAKVNVPWGPLPDGSYHIDENTGILWADDPLCHMAQAFTIDDGPVEVGSDGAIVVTAGYEVYDNHTGGLTSVLLSSGDDEDDSTPEAEIVGANRPSPLKAKIVRSPRMRMYQADLGTPMNLHECEAQALDAGAGELTVPKVLGGRTFTFSGLVLAMLDGGVNTVQHAWDSESRQPAYTYVAVNAPGCRAPVFPVDAAPPETPHWTIREYEQQGREGF